MNKTIELLQGIPYFNEWLTKDREKARAEERKKARAEEREKARAEERKKFNEELNKRQAEFNKRQAEFNKMQAEEHAKWIEAARKLKQLGLNNESIVETTRLPLKEVRSLK